ncbi:MAG TPA: hypothetical protein PK919_03235 [Candidatus Aminicenantes bacterium]|nr:hypothetical protein [Candidatus Aminicenantes bacterium]
MPRKSLMIASVAAAALLLQGCAELGDIARALTSLKRLQFRLDGVSDFTMAGVALGPKSQPADFSVEDGVRLLAAFKERQLPARFLLNVEARNPNDGTEGTTRTVSTLTRFDWRLLIDGKPTVSGGIDRAIEIPGSGQTTALPLRVELDLYEFFGQGGYRDLLELALALGGRNGDIRRVALEARPSVSTPLGEIAWPEPITIVSHEFR